MPRKCGNMLDLVKMIEMMDILISDDMLMQGIASQSRFIVSCENETLNSIRLLSQSVEILDGAKEGYRDEPTGKSMWAFKLALDEVIRLKKRLEFHRAAEFQAIEELSRLQSKHADSMPEFFSAQIYLCNCMTS